jgi:hypothetical protein
VVGALADRYGARPRGFAHAIIKSDGRRVKKV